MTEAAERMRLNFDRLNADVDLLAWEPRPAPPDMLGLDDALQTFAQPLVVVGAVQV